MSLLDALRGARAFVAGGWAEPFPLTVDGHITTADDEGVWTVDVDSAVRAHASDGREAADALELLESIACPATAALNRADPDAVTNSELAAITQAAIAAPQFLGEWLTVPGRSHKQMLELFDMALCRAKRGHG